jgi:hypothetical protein
MKILINSQSVVMNSMLSRSSVGRVPRRPSLISVWRNQNTAKPCAKAPPEGGTPNSESAQDDSGVNFPKHNNRNGNR